GHLDGTGLTGNLHLRNEQIRDYCIANDKILYDFADIESYDPDGSYYGGKLANDGCYYDSDNNGSLDRNWAIDWQNTHVQGVDWYNCPAAHTQPLNANFKAYAAWAMWAEIADLIDRPMPGDTDEDGDVDCFDYLALKANLGMPSGAEWSDGDFDGNGTVDRVDFHALVANFGYLSSSPSAVAPEPAALSLLALGGIALSWRRRRSQGIGRAGK
ncbi:MAG: dockerin type I domain-containing protein, partial [Phycisphaerae bacterium]